MQLVENSGVTRSIRDLLDDARACQVTDEAAARSMAQQARVLARSLNDEAGEAEALFRLASIAYTGGQPGDAFALALDARDLARKAGVTVIEAFALNVIGLVHESAGNFTEALEYGLKALEVYRTTKDRAAEGALLNAIASIHHELGDTDRALVTYEAALTVSRDADRDDANWYVNHVLILNNMAEVRARRNEHLLAVSLASEALDLSRDHVPEYVPLMLTLLASSYCELQMIDQSDEYLTEAEELLEETSAEIDRDALFGLAMVRGKVAMARGDIGAAADHYRRALEIAKSGADIVRELKALTQLAATCKQLGDFEAALGYQEERFRVHETIFSDGADLRIKTLQVAHDTEAARQQAEILRLRTGELEALVRGRTYDLEEYQLEAFQRLAVLAEFRDTDTGEHTIRVGDLSASIATELGSDREWVSQLRLAGRLHDIGKVAVPDSILMKPGPLTPAEFDVMKTHTTIGAEILAGSSSPLIQLAAEVALNHHERWDGSGYPNGLAAEGIPLSGRIVTVADVYDALTSHRTYKHAWTPLEAITYIVGARGAQFEPQIVDAFVRVMRVDHPELAAELDALAV
ncbi:MAG: tetratricopeptide repeat protein [Actinobacteria bacterium]|nr:tetratricopeptide repeat protein [Actinomycetota bacterium]